MEEKILFVQTTSSGNFIAFNIDIDAFSRMTIKYNKYRVKSSLSTIREGKNVALKLYANGIIIRFFP